jgi:hypothetical protein
MASNSTLQDLRDDLDGRLSASKVSGFWTQALKDKALNDGGKQAMNAYRWPFAELALTTQSRDSKEYYDYPAAPNAFTADSIYQVNVAGEDYGANDGRTRVNWGQFQKRKNIGDDSEYVFTNHNGFWFLYPVPADGLEISLFGLKQWRVLVNAGDELVTPSDLDDSIVKLALARCLRKAKKYSEAKAELLEVLDPQVGSLALLWAKVHEESPGGYKGEAQSSRW